MCLCPALLLSCVQVAEHCSEQGMQFLLAVRGCPQDNSIYTPVIPLPNLQCNALGAGGLNNGTAGGAMGMAGRMGGGAGMGGALGGSSGVAGLSDAPQAAGGRRKSSAGAAHGSLLAAAAAVLGGAVAAALL